MGSRASINLQEEELLQLQKETGFSRKQIIRLYGRFTSLDKSGNGHLMREDFNRIPELAINPLAPRIINLFYTLDRRDDDPEQSATETINFRQFVKTLARFQPVRHSKQNTLNSREQKLKFAFNMYDLDGDDMISRSELLSVLHMMVGANISE
jgi:calcineurin B family protein 1